MTYSEAIDYLYARLPVFHRVGAKAIKPGLGNITRLCDYLGNPQERLTCLHIGGTNGKGSSSHLLAAVLQSAGYKTGLYTSPHLKAFPERIRVDGAPVSEDAVAAFVTQHRAIIEEIEPSFFEITVALAFDYFAREGVDVAVIEVGLGGRLDSTNIITPIASLITNIGWDHSDILGDTLEAIAYEKAGIIKPGVPAVISERDPVTEGVFEERARATNSDLVFASDQYTIIDQGAGPDGRTLVIHARGQLVGTLVIGLLGGYQVKNTAGVLALLEAIKAEFPVSWSAVAKGFRQVTQLTGLKGRWQILQNHPLVICDTAHNEPGLTSVLESLESIPFRQLHLVLGFVKDKDLSKVIRLFPQQARYYFCQPDIPRALDSDSLQQAFADKGLVGERYISVNEALGAALAVAEVEDCILVTGSTYVVAELNQL